MELEREPPREVSELPPLDPSLYYKYDVLKRYPKEQVRAYEKAYEKMINEVRRARAATPMATPAQQAAIAEQIMDDAQENAVIQYNAPIGPARPSRALIARQELSRPKMGDTKLVLQGYKETSLCNTLVADALQRAYMAIELLDKDHAKIIRARLAKAGITNANASHVGEKDITFKKAVSIAAQAEQWVYQAQAAAAKSMAKHSKRCAHNIAGRPRLTTAEKEARYMKRFGVARGTRTDRAIRKHQKKAAEMAAWKSPV